MTPDKPAPPLIHVRLLGAALVFLALLIVFSLPQWDLSPNVKAGLAAIGATCFGACVGVAELVARYRDNPWAALRTRGAQIYVVLNAGVALGVFLLIFTGRLSVGAGMFGPEHLALNAAFLGGFGGVALLRASIANVRLRDRTVSVGPAFVLQIVLDATDRACDRERGETRVERVRQIMTGVVYERARTQLPFFAYAILQNLTAEERNSFDQALRGIKESGMSDEGKAFCLGLVMMDVLGEDLLARAVDNLSDRIRGPQPDDATMPIFVRVGRIEASDLPALLAACRALTLERGVRSNPPATEPDWAKLINGDLPMLPPGFDASVNKIDDAARKIIVLAALRSFFGAETVSQALGALMASVSAAGEAEHEGEDDAGREPPPEPDPAGADENPPAQPTGPEETPPGEPPGPAPAPPPAG